jgi:hypothetical protein
MLGLLEGCQALLVGYQALLVAVVQYNRGKRKLIMLSCIEQDD